MGEPAEALEPDAGNISALPGADTPLSINRKAEGGLSLQFSFDIPKLPKMMALGSWTHQQLINAALLLAVVLLGGWTIYQARVASSANSATTEAAATNTRANVATTFNPTVDKPQVAAGAYVDNLASVIGDVQIGAKVYVAPFASIRGDEGQPIVIGAGSNVQDGVVIHALETFESGQIVEKNQVLVDGKKYAVFIGAGVSLAHQSQVHGPAAVGDHTFVGMQALVFKSIVAKNCVIEPGAKVIGVTIAEGRYVPAGAVITTQDAADALPKITDSYQYARLNDGVLHVNEQFADKYLELSDGGSQAKAAPGGEGH
jgi:carbonic anhydrase/acetyltransferase-like protein (isoleucine patch superfamily)